MTKEVRVSRSNKELRRLAMRSEEILDKDPGIYMYNLASRLGMSQSRLNALRRQFGCRRLRDIPRRKECMRLR